MLTIYVVSTGHHKFLKKALSSVIDYKCKLFVIETSHEESLLNKSKQIINKLNLDFYHLPRFKLPEVANFVLSKTKTKFLMRLDADDWLSGDFIKEILRDIEKDYYDMYVPSYFETNEAGTILREVSRAQLLTSTLKDNPPHGACTVFSTDFLRRIGGYSDKYDRQDGYYLWLKILKYGSFTVVPKAKFFYRRHDNNLTVNRRGLWDVRASMLVDECFEDIAPKSYCVLPILNRESLYGRLVELPFMGHPSLLHYELNKLNLNCELVVYGPESLKGLLPNNIAHIVRKKFTADQWTDIQNEVIHNLGIDDGYICVKNIEFPFVNRSYIEAAISAIHLFNASTCITVQELKKDIYSSTQDGLKKIIDGEIHDNNRKYKRSGGVTARRIENGCITTDTLVTSLPADGLSALRVTEMKDFDDLKELFI